MTSPSGSGDWLRDSESFLREVRREYRRAGAPRVAGYSQLEQLDGGSQGRIFRAVQDSTGRVVALKVLTERPGKQVKSVHRFRSEMEMVSRMKHPNIVTVHDCGVTEAGQLYLAMELVEGPNLHDCLPVGLDRPIPTRRSALEVLCEICAAVTHAHQRGVIHRDLKPGNVVLDASGHPKVTDFGLAKDLSGSAGGIATEPGEFLGSLAYASPEQLEGRCDDVDVRTDVYALGAILYQMLTGEAPHDPGVGLAKLVKSVTEEPPVSPSERLRARVRRSEVAGAAARRIDRDLDTMCLTALARRQEDRYPTVEHFRCDLRRYLEGRPILARRQTLPYLLGKKLMRDRKAAAMVFATVGMFSAAGWLGSEMGGFNGDVGAETIPLDGAASTIARSRWMRSDVLPRLRDRRGTEEVYRVLLEERIPELRRLLQEDPADQELSFEYAAFLHWKADLLLKNGALDEAERLQKVALPRMRDAVEAQPRPSWKETLSLLEARCGDREKELGRLARARGHYQEAVAIDEDLARRSPTDPHYQDNLFWSHHRLGHLAAEQGRAEEAQREFATLLPIAEATRDLDPDRPQTLAMLFQAHAELAREALRACDVETAGRHSGGALRNARTLFRTDTTQTVWTAQLIAAQRLRAQALLAAGSDPERAVDLADAAWSRAKELSRTEPQVSAWEEDVAHCLEVRRAVLEGTGATQAEIEEVWLAILELRTRLAERLPHKLTHARRSVAAQSSLGELCRRAGQLTEALEWLVRGADACLAHPKLAEDGELRRMLARGLHRTLEAIHAEESNPSAERVLDPVRRDELYNLLNLLDPGG